MSMFMVGKQSKPKPSVQPHPLSLRIQLTLGIGLILSLVAISAVIGYLSLRSLQTSTEDTLLTANRIRDLSLAIQNDFLLSRQNEAGLLTDWQSSGFDVSASVFVTAHHSNLDQVKVHLENIASLVQSTKSVDLQSLKTEIDSLRPLLEDYQKTFEKTEAVLREITKAGGPLKKPILDASLAQNIDRSDELASEINRETGMIGIKSEAGLDWARRQNDRINRNATITLGVSAGLMILLGMIAAIGLARWMLLPFNELVQAARQIGQGDLSARANPRGGTELTTLAEALNSMADQMQRTLGGLEQRVTERTRDLEHRTSQLQAAAEIASAVGSGGTAAGQLSELLSQTANLILERFGYSQVHIFTLDETGEWVVLRASAGYSASGVEDSGATYGGAGHDMAFRLHAGDSNPTANVLAVAQAIINGQPQLSTNTPGLTPTYTELALPLRTRGKVTGALDVHIQQAYGLDTGLPGATMPGEQTRIAEDITVLQILADQLAIAIWNAQLFQELQDRLRELETLYAHQSQETWQRLAQAGLHGYRYELGGIVPLTEEINAVAGSTEDSGAIGGGEVSPISLPITVRGQVIGSLDVWPETESWPQEKISMLQAINDRLSQAIDSAQLFEEIQRRVSRERMLNQLTASFTQSLDLDTLLTTAIQELSHLPDIAEVSIFIGMFESSLAGPGISGEENEDAAAPVDVAVPATVLSSPFNRQVSPLYRVRSQGSGVEHSGAINTEARQALLENRTILSPASSFEPNAGGREGAAIAIPIHLRGQVFGVLNLRFRSQPITQETVDTFQEITNRLSLVLENTRLHYETEQRAERERAITEITSRVRATTNIDVIMRTAIQELAEKLDISTAAIRIRGNHGDEAHG